MIDSSTAVNQGVSFQRDSQSSRSHPCYRSLAAGDAAGGPRRDWALRRAWRPRIQPASPGERGGDWINSLAIQRWRLASRRKIIGTDRARRSWRAKTSVVRRSTFAPSQEERRVAEATARGRLSRLQLARRRLRHRRCWASILQSSGGSRSCIETRTSSSARTATQIVATTLLETFSPLKSVAPSPTRAIEHFQDDRNRAIRLFSGFY